MAAKLEQLERQQRDMQLAIQKLSNTSTKPAHIGKEYVQTSKICPSPVELLLALPAGFDNEKFLKREWPAADYAGAQARPIGSCVS